MVMHVTWNLFRGLVKAPDTSVPNEGWLREGSQLRLPGAVRFRAVSNCRLPTRLLGAQSITFNSVSDQKNAFSLW